MVLAMCRPVKHPTTGVYLFRKRVPTHLRSLVGKLEVKRSLGTKDPKEAKRRLPEMLEAVEREWAMLQAAPTSLSHKEIIRLAGVAYRDIVGVHPNNPGPASVWEHHIRISEEARAKGKLDQWVGPYVDALLVREGIKTTAECRLTIIEETDKAVVQAAQQRLKEAQGDYSPDPRANRFPLKEAPVPGGGVTITALFRSWEAAHSADGMSPTTATKRKPIVEEFIEFLGHEDAARVTRVDVTRWRDHLRQKRKPLLAAKTVRDTYFAALRAIFARAADDGTLATNPFPGVRVRLPQRTRERERGFSNAEARLILAQASSAPSNPGRASPHLVLARRWVPWLCAYTGARVGEIAQLRKEDVHQDGDIHYLRITPEAGTVKTKQYRDVPLHPHMIRQGFLAFVAKAPKGPLFYSRSALKAGKAPWTNVSGKLSKWARQAGVTDTRVQPNHGWRHRFKTVGRDAGIDERVLDAICGHAPKTAGADYGDVSLRAMAEGLAKFPTQGTTEN
jgi:integrase